MNNAADITDKANLPETAETNLKKEIEINQDVLNNKKAFAVSGQVEPMVMCQILIV